jgi:hypothetical protein
MFTMTRLSGRWSTMKRCLCAGFKILILHWALDVRNVNHVLSGCTLERLRCDSVSASDLASKSHGNFYNRNLYRLGPPPSPEEARCLRSHAHSAVTKPNRIVTISAGSETKKRRGDHRRSADGAIFPRNLESLRCRVSLDAFNIHQSSSRRFMEVILTWIL